MEIASVRYIVEDVAEALDFYRDRLGFEVVTHPAPGFAMLTRGALRLLLNAPAGGGGGQAMPDGRVPEPGGWNRIQVVVADFDAAVEAFEQAGVVFRGEVVTGRGGRQVLIEDPSGNPVEVFEPAGE